jgi:hypothetical protein
MCVCIYMYVHKCLYVYVCMHVCIYVCIFIQAYKYICIYVCMYVCMCVCVCVYIQVAPLTPLGVQLINGRMPTGLQTDEWRKGLFEVQDIGSQVLMKKT